MSERSKRRNPWAPHVSPGGPSVSVLTLLRQAHTWTISHLRVRMTAMWAMVLARYVRDNTPVHWLLEENADSKTWLWLWGNWSPARCQTMKV